MAQNFAVDSTPPHESSVESGVNIAEIAELSMNRLERMLDWLLLARENVANLNLDLYSVFKPLETFHCKSDQQMQNESKITCPLHPDCNRITNLVISTLKKIPDQ